MLLAYSDMLHSPVAAADPGERVGSVVDVIAEAHAHRVIAFAVRTGSWFGATKFLSPDDVIEYDPHALIVSTPDVLVEPSEIVRAAQIDEHHDRVLKRAVVTQAGEALGAVTNYVIDTETAGIVRYYVKSLLGPERIIPVGSVVEVTKDSFVVRDSRGSAKAATAEVEAAGA